MLARWTRFIGGIIVCVVLVGCSQKSGSVGSLNDAAQGISETLELLNEFRGDNKKTASLFAQGTSVPDGNKLSKYSFSLRGSHSIDGTSATLKVAIYDESAGKDLGEFDWTFEKDGQRWKIKSLQLP